MAAAYFGFRVWCKEPEAQTDCVVTTVQEGLDEIRTIVPLIRNYNESFPSDQWEWKSDTDRAERYFKAIAIDGWPRKTEGALNPEGGKRFSLRGAAGNRSELKVTGPPA